MIMNCGSIRSVASARWVALGVSGQSRLVVSVQSTRSTKISVSILDAPTVEERSGVRCVQSSRQQILFSVETAFKPHLNASAVACYTAAHRSPSMARRSLHRPSRRRNCCVFARASAVGHPPSASGRPSALAIPHPRYHYYIIIIIIIIVIIIMLSLLYCIYIIIIIIIIIIILHIYHYHHHYHIARGSSI